MGVKVNTRDLTEVRDCVGNVHRSLFPDADPKWVPRVIGWIEECFCGTHPGYQAIDARYHDLEHTLQGTVCLARLLEGRQRAKADPQIGRRDFELCLLAMLFHDTGYLKARGDEDGTGAKYTAVHVHRSARFAEAFLEAKGYSRDETLAIENMICCTGVNADLSLIPFQNEREQVCGWCLATADLLGQMAAPDYVEKLPALFEEFAEAAQFTGLHNAPYAQIATAEELIRRTPGFWTNYVLPRLQNDFGAVYKYLNEPYPEGPNEYLQEIEANLRRVAR